jgi:hypothetical protein
MRKLNAYHLLFIISESNSYKPTYEFPERKVEPKPKEGTVLSTLYTVVPPLIRPSFLQGRKVALQEG